MFQSGLVEETRQLAEKYGDDARPLTSLGYRQALATLKGEMTLAEAVTSAQQGHRNYAKRQMTWFRREPEVHWLNGFGDETQVRKEAAADHCCNARRRLLANANSETLHLSIKMAPLQAKRLGRAAHISVAIVDFLENVIPFISLARLMQSRELLALLLPPR